VVAELGDAATGTALPASTLDTATKERREHKELLTLLAVLPVSIDTFGTLRKIASIRPGIDLNAAFYVRLGSVNA
jgi:hypothetical protein